MKKRSLNFKLIFVMMILVVGSVAIAGIGLSRLSLMKETLTSLVEERAARVSLGKDLRALFYVQLINEKNFLLEDENSELTALAERLQQRHKEIGEKIHALKAISADIGKQEADEFLKIYDMWWANIGEMKEHRAQDRLAAAKALSLTKSRELRLKGEAIIESFATRNEKHMQEEVTRMQQEYTQARALMILVSLLAIVVGGSIGAFVLVSLSRGINGVIENLSSSSDQVSAASEQIATAATELSEATTEQASSLEETVATIEELSSMVKVNADNAQMASQLSNEMNNVAVKGEKEMAELVHSMEEISKDSKKISDIINVIDDIAFQTNLLALNAAVEAARAGEQGKGFAVVAEAVRTLSQRSSAAAKDISELIGSSVDRISAGSEQARKSGTILGDIVLSVKKVSQLNQEIAAASSEQSNGINQISKAMNQLDQVTQVNAASSEEAAASAEELSAQAETLSSVIVTLVESVKGEHGAVTPAEHGKKAVGLVKRIAKVKTRIDDRPAKSPTSNEDLLPLDTAG